MDSFNPKYKRQDREKLIQISIIKKLRYEKWFVMITHGNMFSEGWPDLYATHTSYGQRWVEVKKPNMKGSKFTPAQLDTFPKLCANGAGVWVLTADSDIEYRKLFERFNWWHYTAMMKGNMK